MKFLMIIAILASFAASAQMYTCKLYKGEVEAPTYVSTTYVSGHTFTEALVACNLYCQDLDASPNYECSFATVEMTEPDY